MRLRPEFGPDSGTHLLLSQLEEYLWHLGYYFMESDLVEHLTEYGNALMTVAKHEATTRKHLRALLSRLGRRLNGHPGLEALAFMVRDKGAGEMVTRDWANFDFLNADLPGLQAYIPRIAQPISRHFSVLRRGRQAGVRYTA